MRLPSLKKLFPFLSIRRKPTIAFVAFSLLSLVVFGLYGYFGSVQALREEAVQRNDLAWMASALEARDEQIRTYAGPSIQPGHSEA